jgi:hypothetical protein
MTSAERLIAALQGDPVDRLPFSPFLAYVWESFPRAVQDAGQLAFHQGIGADPLWRGAPCPVRMTEKGVAWHVYEKDSRKITVVETPVGTLRMAHQRSAAGNTDFLVEHPLKTPEDFKVQTWIEEHRQYELNLEPVREHFAANGREGLSIGMLVPRGKSAYQSLVEHLVGTEELIYAVCDFPEVVHELLEAMVTNDLCAVSLAIESPYEYFLSWEDSSTQNYSPTQYDQYIGSEIGEWCRILGQSGKRYLQHACGHVRALVPRMQAHGAYGVESISPPPTGNISIADARAAVGSDFAIIGGIEPTMFLNLQGTEFDAYVEQTISAGQGGPFVLANSDSCPPGVTVEKFARVAEIVRAFR